MKSINKFIIITTLSLVSVTSFARSQIHKGSTLDEVHAKIAAKAKEAGAGYRITEAYTGNKVHMTAELTH